jgi:agmatine deiminase
MSRAFEEYGEITRLIANDERVVLVCRDEDQQLIRSCVPSNVDLVVHQVDDGWIRDNGPVGVEVSGSLLAVDFAFNSWGGRFSPWDGDASAGQAIAKYLGVDREVVPFVLEGGAISFNGNGTALVVEECVLHPNRNGDSISKKHFEAVISRHLGVRKVVWLPFGLLEDLPNTDGHVDNVAVFVSETMVLAQMVRRTNPNFSRLSRNLDAIRSSRGAQGEKLEVEVVASLPYSVMPSGTLQPVPYLNFAVTNQSVLVPSVETPTDDQMTRFMMDVFPGRTARVVSSYALAHGGGGPHCITMQWPRH